MQEGENKRGLVFKLAIITFDMQLRENQYFVCYSHGIYSFEMIIMSVTVI